MLKFEIAEQQKDDVLKVSLKEIDGEVWLLVNNTYVAALRSDGKLYLCPLHSGPLASYLTLNAKGEIETC